MSIRILQGDVFAKMATAALFSDETRPTLSRLPLNAQSCGSDGKVFPDFHQIDFFCFGLDGERRVCFEIHRVRKIGIFLSRRQESLLAARIAQRNDWLGFGSAFEASRHFPTVISFYPNEKDAFAREARVLAFPRQRPIYSRDGHLKKERVYGKTTLCSQSFFRMSDRRVLGMACDIYPKIPSEGKRK